MKPLLLIDAVTNLVLGAFLLCFPLGVDDLLGLPAAESAFYPTILDGVQSMTEARDHEFAIRRITMTRDIIATDKAPGAVGPYSQGIRTNQFIFTAGQIPVDPATGSLIDGPIEDQTRRVLDNVRAVLEAAGTGLDKVVKMTVFMTDLGDFKRMNAVYAEYFPDAPPARSAVQVAALPLGSDIEMEAIALIASS